MPKALNLRPLNLSEPEINALQLALDSLLRDSSVSNHNIIGRIGLMHIESIAKKVDRLRG